MFKIKIKQMICYLLSLNNNKMNLLKLMKELYLADRSSIAERDTSISGDTFCSLPHGPVLSITLNLINCDELSDCIKTVPARYYPDVICIGDPGSDFLSQKDKEIIKNISDTFKDYTPKQLEEYTHTLPEWKDPQGSSLKIRYRDIMSALGKTEEETLAAKQEYDRYCALKDKLGL